MASITFSKTGVTTLTFTRADAFPRSTPGDEGQLVSESQAGLVRVATLRPPRSSVQLTWAGRTAMLVSDYVALGVFLRHALILFRANPFTWTDVDDSTALVRYWGGYFEFAQMTPLLMQGHILLRREVT